MKNISANMQKLIDTILQTRYSDLDTDFKCCHELLRIAQQRHSAWGIAFAYTYLGDYYIATNDMVQSGAYLMLAKEICLQNPFNEIYMKVCHFMGLYYSMLYDEQNALKYYLDGLELARTFNDKKIECLILNNIAHEFHCRDSYENAKFYYFEAMAIFTNNEDHGFDRLKVLVWCNLIDLFIIINDLPMAEKYLQLCKELEVESADIKSSLELLMCTNMCCLAAISKNRQDADYHAESLLKQISVSEDTHATSKMLVTACKAMIELKAQEYSRKILDKLSEICITDDTFILKQLVTLNVRYHSIFSGKEEQNQAYRDYFDTVSRVTEIEFNIRVDGMKAKINLREILSQQESILQEKHDLEVAANIDGLTEIYNRRYINKLLLKMNNSVDIIKMGIVMIDVDYFKEYNDNYGHAQGDEVLIKVAKVLSNFSSDNFVSGRYGGDEFICLLIDKEDEDIESLIIGIYNEIAVLSIPHKKSYCSPIVTLSCGYSNIEVGQGFSAEKLLKKADRALYNSKIHGRNQRSKYDENYDLIVMEP